MDSCCEPLQVEATGAEHQLAVRGFVALWTGQRPSPDDLDADLATIDTMRRHGRIVLDPDGRIAGIHGLSARPTPHRIAHADQVIHTWCAFDAVGIPAALRLDARATTTCPTCGRPLEVSFTEGEPAADGELRLWVPSSPCDHVLDDVCAHANLYCDTQHLADHTPPAGTALTVPRAAALGRATWHDAATALTTTH
jgi:Alkylmercury lyase